MVSKQNLGNALLLPEALLLGSLGHFLRSHVIPHKSRKEMHTWCISINFATKQTEGRIPIAQLSLMYS